MDEFLELLELVVKILDIELEFLFQTEKFEKINFFQHGWVVQVFARIAFKFLMLVLTKIAFTLQLRWRFGC